MKGEKITASSERLNFNRKADSNLAHYAVLRDPATHGKFALWRANLRGLRAF